MADFYGGAGKSPGINWMAIMQVLQQQGNNILSILQSQKEAQARAQERQEDRQFQLNLFERKQAAEEAQRRADAEDRERQNARQIQIATAQNINSQIPALRNLLYQTSALPDDQEISPEIKEVKDGQERVVRERYTVGTYRARLEDLLARSQGLLKRVGTPDFDTELDTIAANAAELESTGSALVSAYTKKQEEMKEDRKMARETVLALANTPGLDPDTIRDLVYFAGTTKELSPDKIKELFAKFPQQGEVLFKSLTPEMQYARAQEEGWINAAAPGAAIPEDELKKIPSFWMKDGKLTDLARTVISYGKLQGEKELKTERTRVGAVFSSPDYATYVDDTSRQDFARRLSEAQTVEDVRSVEMEFASQVGKGRREREVQERNDQNARAVLPVLHANLEKIQPYLTSDAYKEYIELQSKTNPTEFQNAYLAFMNGNGKAAMQAYWAQQGADLETKNNITTMQQQLLKAQVDRLPFEEQRLKLDITQATVATNNRAMVQGLVDNKIISQKEANFYFANMSRDEALKNLGLSGQAIQAFNNAPNPFKGNQLMSEGEYRGLVDKTLNQVKESLQGVMDKDTLANTLQQLRNAYMSFYGAQAYKNNEVVWNRKMDAARLQISRAGLALDRLRYNLQKEQGERQEQRMDLSEIRATHASLEARRQTIVGQYKTQLDTIDSEARDAGCSDMSRSLMNKDRCMQLSSQRNQALTNMQNEIYVIDQMRTDLEKRLGVVAPLPPARATINYTKVGVSNGIDPRVLTAARIAAQETGVPAEYLVGLNAGENEIMTNQPHESTGAAGYWQITREQLKALAANPKFQQKYPDLYKKLVSGRDIAAVAGSLGPEEQGYLYAGYLMFNNRLALELGRTNNFEDFAVAHFSPSLLNGQVLARGTQAFNNQAAAMKSAAPAQGIDLATARQYYRNKAAKVLNFENVDSNTPDDKLIQDISGGLKDKNSSLLNDMRRYQELMNKQRTRTATGKEQDEILAIRAKWASQFATDPTRVDTAFAVYPLPAPPVEAPKLHPRLSAYLDSAEIVNTPLYQGLLKNPNDAVAARLFSFGLGRKGFNMTTEQVMNYFKSRSGR